MKSYLIVNVKLHDVLIVFWNFFFKMGQNFVQLMLGEKKERVKITLYIKIMEF